MKDVFEKCPLPWEAKGISLYSDGARVGGVHALKHSLVAEDRKLAEEIVHRVNTYSDLYEALKNLVGKVEELEPPINSALACLQLHGGTWDGGNWGKEMGQARAALAKHEGRQ